MIGEIRGLAENFSDEDFATDSFTIDLSGIETASELHKRISLVLKFPDYYGNNLNALFDVLCDEHPLWSITFTSCKEAEEKLGNEYFESFKQTFADAAEENELVRAKFL